MKTKFFKLGIIFSLLVVVVVFNMSTTAEDVSEDAAKIDINTATIEQLQSIKGIGESYAVRIVEYRKHNGPFQKTEDILKVKGIGEKLYQKIRDQLEVKVE